MENQSLECGKDKKVPQLSLIIMQSINRVSKVKFHGHPSLIIQSLAENMIGGQNAFHRGKKSHLYLFELNPVGVLDLH
jgi:hypothetical protein